MVAQKPRMIPCRKPQVLQVSPTTARNRLSSGNPYCPCIFTLKSSTTKPDGLLNSVFWWKLIPHVMMIGRTGTCKNRVDGAGHRSCQRYLRKCSIREGCNNTLRDVVRSKEERVDCCNPNQGARHTCRADRESASIYKGPIPTLI